MLHSSARNCWRPRATFCTDRNEGNRSRGAILQNHGLIAVGEDLRKAATRASMIEETAKLALYVKQFGGTVSLVPEAGMEQLASITDFI